MRGQYVFAYFRDDESNTETSDNEHPVPSNVFVIKMANAQGGRKAGSGNYSKEEQMAMLDILVRLQPISPDEWKAVADELAALFPPGREVDSIRRKFATLHRKSTVPVEDQSETSDRVDLSLSTLWETGTGALAHPNFPRSIIEHVHIEHRFKERQHVTEHFMINAATIQQGLVIATAKHVSEGGLAVLSQRYSWCSSVSSSPIFRGQLDTLFLLFIIRQQTVVIGD